MRPLTLLTLAMVTIGMMTAQGCATSNAPDQTAEVQDLTPGQQSVISQTPPAPANSSQIQERQL